MFFLNTQIRINIMRERWNNILLYQALCLLCLYSSFSSMFLKYNKGINETIESPLEYCDISSERNNAYAPYNRKESLIKYPPQFLPNFKNPCWREKRDNDFQIFCVPYYFIVGTAKCGSSDLLHRLLKHPLNIDYVRHEDTLDWIAKARFTTEGIQPVSIYLDIFREAVQKKITVIQNNGYYYTIFGDSSVALMWNNFKLLSKVFTANMKEPPYTNANVVYNLNPRAKIIIILRNPITRAYSDYLFFSKNTSVSEFHKKVVSTIYTHENCLKNYSLRYCAYFIHGKVALHVGWYNVYIEDYLRVFPREQLKVIRLEDVIQNITETVGEVFTFLEIGVPTENVMKTIKEESKMNTNTKVRKRVGEMFPKTWTLLYQYYKPYNDRLGKLLGEKFNYNSPY